MATAGNLMAEQRRPMDESKLPLEGIRVVEISHFVMGPACGMFLRLLGAEVIKVEPPAGEDTRTLKGMGLPIFPLFNRGKRSLTLALETEAGQEALHRLLAKSDVLIENFRDSSLAAMGLDHDELRQRYSKLIIAGHKGFLRGPYQDRPAMDEVVQMMAGLAYMTGPSGRPLRIGCSGNDILGGLQGAFAVLASLLERQRSGRGQTIRVGLFETCLLMVAQHMVQFELSGIQPPPMPERDFSWPVYDIFETADEQPIFIGVITHGHWCNFCELLDLNELLADESLTTTMERIEARPRIIPRIAAKVATLSYASLAEQLEQAGLTFAPINRPADMYDDPHVNRTGGLQTSRNFDGKGFRVPAPPIEFEGQTAPVELDVRLPGEDSELILTELGYSPTEIASLSAVTAERSNGG